MHICLFTVNRYSLAVHKHFFYKKKITFNNISVTVHSRTYCDRCLTSDVSDLTCQTTGRMETGAIKRVIKLES